MKLLVTYPAQHEERQILDRALATEHAKPEPVLSADQLLSAQQALHGVHLDERLRDYVVSLCRATRDPRAAGVDQLDNLIEIGASPRAVIGLAQAARAQAFLNGQTYVTPQDIKAVAPDVLRHRIMPSYEAEAEGLDHDALINRLLDHVPVP